MRAIFIRHGQSTGNARIPADDLSTISLTELGREQSREVATSWTETPDLIVTSPYLRAQQTAAPTIARYPEVPVEVWPVEEFTYLQPSRWNGTQSNERTSFVERYWKQADPRYCDGEGAENFSALLRRAETALDRLTFHPTASLIYLFSHGQFIQAVRSVVVDQTLEDYEKMRKFWRKGAPPTIANAGRLELICEDGLWQQPGAIRYSFPQPAKVQL